MTLIERILFSFIIAGLVITNYILIFQLSEAKEREKQKEYQIRIREKRANQKVRDAEKVIKDNTIYLGEELFLNNTNGKQCD